jgi:glycosyltransferase involved in cell wall biosynthesis
MGKMLPNLTISIITPSYNQAAYLEQTIQSVINQNYPAIEYIIIDGGSTDDSVEVIQKYSSHFAYWVSEKDRGQSDAINKGLKLATGDIVCWLNSDDLFEPNTLNTIAQFFNKNTDAKFIYGDGLIFHENGKKRDFHCRPGKVNKEMLSRCDPLQQPSTFWRRKIHNEIGFIDESLGFTMDWDFFMRIALKYEMHYLPITFSRYRIHDAHKTGVGGERRSKEILNFIEKYGDQKWKTIYSLTYPYADEIRKFRNQFGWRLGRFIFYFKHPKLAISCGLSLSVAMNMY